MTFQNKASTKTMARFAAVQVIYQYKPEEQNQDVNLLMQQLIQFYQDERGTNDLSNSITIKFSIGYFEKLVKAVVLNLSQVDNVIMKYLSNEWRITNLPILLLALLRVAVSELLYFPEVPIKVVINEFTGIAGDMINEHEIAFVNSILDKIAKNRGI